MPINLLYHDVTPPQSGHTSGFPGAGAARYKLTTVEFEQHLDRIASVVRHPPSVPTSPEQSFKSGVNDWTITFDDGGSSAITEIAGRLEKRGWRGWFFIATDYIDTPAFCSREQLKELHRRGHCIGTHSCSHPERISDCAWDQLIDEWSRSRSILEQILQQPVTTASVPGGFYSTQVARAAVQSGVRILCNSEPTTSAFELDGTLILGRYNVYQGMSAIDAAALISSPGRRWRQSAFWNLKKIAKVAAGPLYKQIRHRILNRQYDQRDS